MTPGVRFEMGELVATSNCLAWADEEGVDLQPLLARHLLGDWGDLDQSDAAQNEAALKSGEARLFSAYETESGKVWIITEWDRSVTTILRPDDY